MSEPRNDVRELVVFEGEDPEVKALAWQRRRAANVIDAALAPAGLRINRPAIGLPGEIAKRSTVEPKWYRLSEAIRRRVRRSPEG